MGGATPAQEHAAGAGGQEGDDDSDQVRSGADHGKRGGARRAAVAHAVAGRPGGGAGAPRPLGRGEHGELAKGASAASAVSGPAAVSHPLNVNPVRLEVGRGPR